MKGTVMKRLTKFWWTKTWKKEEKSGMKLTEKLMCLNTWSILQQKGLKELCRSHASKLMCDQFKIGLHTQKHFLIWSRKKLGTMISEARKLREDIAELGTKIQE